VSVGRFSNALSRLDRPRASALVQRSNARQHGLSTRRCCPYLGLRLDSASIFLEPTEEHRCHQSRHPQTIALAHQAVFCLTAACETCPRWPAALDSTPGGEEQVDDCAEGYEVRLPPDGRRGRLRGWLLALVGVAIAVGLIWLFPSRPLTGVPNDADTSRAESRPQPPDDRSVLKATNPDGVTGASDVPMATVPAIRAAPTAAISAALAFRTLLDDGFGSAPQGWLDDPRSTAWWSGGAYHLFAREPGHFVAVGAPVPGRLRDVEVSATFRKTGGPAGGGYGLMVRDQGSGPRDGVDQGGRYYVLEAGDGGDVGIWRREGDHWVDLLPWTPSGAVRHDQATNFLTVRAIAERLTFLVNGEQVASLADPTLPDGTVGVFVGGDSNEVMLERFVVQTPD
jgi:hypothetical protein